MRTDSRCQRLNELNDQYHMLFRQLTERHLTAVCRERQLKEALCGGDFLLLFAVAECGDRPANMAAISKKLNINPSTATRRVNRLLTNELVTKSAAHEDERRYDLRLTELGAQFVDQMDAMIFQSIQTIYSSISDDEFQLVCRFVEKCNAQLQQLLSQA